MKYDIYEQTTRMVHQHTNAMHCAALRSSRSAKMCCAFKLRSFFTSVCDVNTSEIK